jgi:hypothetical protein
LGGRPADRLKISGTARRSLIKALISQKFVREAVRPPQPTMRTDLDIGARNPVTTTVTGFFYLIFSSETG